MTVKELLAILRKMPQDAIVKVTTPDDACEMDIRGGHRYEDADTFETWCVLDGTWWEDEF